MTIEQLKSFCSTDGTRRKLNEPFSQGDWTFATNGHIAIRVARFAVIGEVEGAPDTLKLFRLSDFDDPNRAWVDPPEPIFETVQCRECTGAGYYRPCSCVDGCHKCCNTGWIVCTKDTPKAEPCFDCDGVGSSRLGYVFVTGPKGETRLASIYIELIRTLPNCKIGLFGDESEYKSGKNNIPVCLRFDGGLGLLMPVLK